MNDKTESQIQKEILDYLKLRRVLCFKHRNVGIKKPNGSYIPLAFGEKGISDIIGCLPNGKFLAIEVKQPKGRASPEQLDFLARLNAQGGVGFIAHSLDEAMEWMEPILHKIGTQLH